MVDLSQLSDDELKALYGSAKQATPTSSRQNQIAAQEPLGFADSVGLGFKKASLGAAQAGLDVANFLGADTSALKDLTYDVEKNYSDRGTGSGVAGAVGEAVGGLISPVSIATMGAKIPATALGMIGQGIVQGGVAGLTSPLEKGQNRLAAGAIGATAGAVLNPVSNKATAAVTRKAVKVFNELRFGKPQQKTTQELFDLAAPLRANYEAANNSALQPSGYANAALQIESLVKPKNKVQADIQKSGKDFAYNFYQDNLLPYAKKPLTLSDLDTLDGQFMDAIDKVKPNKMIGSSGDPAAYAKIVQMRKAFKEGIYNAPDAAWTGGKSGAEAWKAHDKLYAAGKASQALDIVIQKAADKDQPSKAISTGLAGILNHPTYSNVFNSKEKEAIRSAIKTGIVGEALRTLSSRLGVFGSVMFGGVEGGLAASTVGGLSRDAAEAMRIKGLDTARQAITSRAIGSPMPMMPNVGTQAGAVGGKVAAESSARAIAGERGTPQAPNALQSLSDEELLQLRDKLKAGSVTIGNEPIDENGYYEQITPQSNTFSSPDMPRGVRNNNPANLRGNDAWLGKSGVDESGFVQFKTPIAGLRAMAVNLATQQKKHGINTVSDLIKKYAPPHENDTVAYIEKVAGDLGVRPNQKIKITDKKTMYKLMQSLIEHENGTQPYSGKEILQAINLGVK